jgi:hypothetical protein
MPKLAFLAAVASARSRTFPGVGEGTDVRFEADAVHGAALVSRASCRLGWPEMAGACGR